MSVTHKGTPQQGVSTLKPRARTAIGLIARRLWIWGGIAFLAFGLAAAYVLPPPAGPLINDPRSCCVRHHRFW
jgi:hypothetical protein